MSTCWRLIARTAERGIETINRAAERIRSSLPGQRLPFKKRTFYMAIAIRFPIVSVALKNTDHAMGKKKKYSAPPVCEMAMLPPPLPVETKCLTAEKDLMNLLKMARRLTAEELAS